MALLAEPSANFHSSRMHRILPESLESSRNLWGTDKTSLGEGCGHSYPLPGHLQHHGSQQQQWDGCIDNGQLYQQRDMYQQ